MVKSGLQESPSLYRSSTLPHSTLLCNDLLYSTLLYSTVLFCTLLYSTLLYSMQRSHGKVRAPGKSISLQILYATALYSTVQCSTLLHSTVLYCTLLYVALLYATLLHYAAHILQCSALLCYANQPPRLAPLRPAAADSEAWHRGQHLGVCPIRGPCMRDAVLLGAYYVPLIFGNSHLRIRSSYLHSPREPLKELLGSVRGY